jgi:excisionase family DNA binding protein
MPGIKYVPNFVKLYLTTTEAGYFLNCSSQKVGNLIRSRELPAIRQGREYRILTDDLLDYAHKCAKERKV